MDNNLNVLENIPYGVSTPTERQVWEWSLEVQCLPSVLKSGVQALVPHSAAATTTVTTMLLAYKQKSKTSNNKNRLLLYAVNKELILKIFTMPM